MTEDISAPPRRRRGRPTQAQRKEIRQSILDAAWAEFVKRGYGDATVQRIAENARVGIATFYAHFSDKRAVFAAMLGDVGGELSAEAAAVGAEASLEEGLQRFAEAFLRPFSLARHVEAARLMYAEARRFPELTELFVKQPEGWIDSLGNFIKRFRPDLTEDTLRDLALLYAEMVAGRLHRERMLGLTWLSEERIPAHLAMCVQVFSAGIGCISKDSASHPLT